MEYNATKSTELICIYEGSDMISLNQAQYWFRKFNDGDLNLEDKNRSGRPISIESSHVKEAIEVCSSKSSRDLSSELCISQSTVIPHLHKLGKKYNSCRAIPYDLTHA